MYIDTTPGSVPSKASSSSCLLAKWKTLPYLTGLNWFAILHRFVPFRSLLRQIQLGKSHGLLHMLNSSFKAVSSAVVPHIHWITSCSSTSMHRPLSLGLGTTGTVDRKYHMPHVIRAWITGHMHQKESSQLNWPAPRLVQTIVSACRWYIYWTSDYFLILFELCSVWRLKHNITSAVHMITRSLKEHTGFTEIRGRLGKAHLLGQMTLFLIALMVPPVMDVTMNASYTFYGIVYLIWFHWIYCFYPWKKTFPGKKHLGLIDILQLSESPVIFLPSITPETCPVAVTLDSMQISLIPAPWNLTRMENYLQLHWGLKLGFWWSNSVASIVYKQDLWCGACASPLILVIVWDGLPTFWPIEVRLDSNVIYSVRGFCTCCLLWVFDITT